MAMGASPSAGRYCLAARTLSCGRTFRHNESHILFFVSLRDTPTGLVQQPLETVSNRSCPIHALPMAQLSSYPFVLVSILCLRHVPNSGHLATGVDACPHGHNFAVSLIRRVLFEPSFVDTHRRICGRRSHYRIHGRTAIVIALTSR